jgi:hypothetical protein
MTKRTIYGLAVFASAACLSSAAWAVGIMPMIAVSNQVPDGKTVTVDEVAIPHDGFVVINAPTDGKPAAPQHIGFTRVKAGFHQNVDIKLDRTPKPGATYVAMLYNDSGQTGKFELGPGATNGDKPVIVNGKEVTEAFKIDKAVK